MRPLPTWVAVASVAPGFALATLVGDVEHGLLRTGVIAALASGAAGGRALGLVLLVGLVDLWVVGLLLAAWSKAWGRHVHLDAGFPWLHTVGLALANWLCLRYDVALGAVAVWASVLALFLFVVIGGE